MNYLQKYEGFFQKNDSNEIKNLLNTDLTDDEIVTNIFNYIKNNFNEKNFTYEPGIDWSATYKIGEYLFHFYESGVKNAKTYVSINNEYYEIREPLKIEIRKYFDDKIKNSQEFEGFFWNKQTKLTSSPTSEEIVLTVFKIIKRNFKKELFEYKYITGTYSWRVNYHVKNYRFSLYVGEDDSEQPVHVNISINSISYHVSDELQEEIIDFFKEKSKNSL